MPEPAQHTIAWAVADLDRDLARRGAEEHEVAKVYGDYRELLADDEVEAVGVATAPDVRKPMVIEALEAGKHVLVQKPHGRNAADVEEINAVAASTGKTLVYSYFMRHQAENKENRQIIAAGRIGRVYHARVHYHYRERGANYEPPPGRSWLYRWGFKGGALGQHGSHYLDQAWFLLGCPQPEWAFAVSHSAFPTTLKVERHSEDYMSFLVGCAGGMTIQMDTSSVIFHLGGPGVGFALAHPWVRMAPLRWNPLRCPRARDVRGRAGCWVPSTRKATIPLVNSRNTATVTSTRRSAILPARFAVPSRPMSLPPRR